MFESLPAGGLAADAIWLCRALVTNEGSLLVAMTLAGLAGGVLHCAGMCGPFVLAQVARGTADDGGRRLTEWRRLRGAALVPYHFGRATTYAALGAVAAAAIGQLESIPALQWLASGLLFAAAVLFVLQAMSMAPRRLLPAVAAMPQWLGGLGHLAGKAALGSSLAHRYGLGLMLGFLPCGMLYAALAAAASTGNAVEGAATMIAFTLGTVPSLIGVGYIGAFLGDRWREAVRPFAATLFGVNATLLGAMAWMHLP